MNFRASTGTGILGATSVPPVSRRQRARSTKQAAAGSASTAQMLPATPESSLDRRTVAIGLLKDGFVQSFVDFFYLFHEDVLIEQTKTDGDKAPPQLPSFVTTTPIDAAEESKSTTEPVAGRSHAPSDLRYVRTCLASAEAATREHNTAVIMDNYSKLADHFESKHDAKTALYFRGKAADVARLTDDPLEEPTALVALGETELAEHECHKAVRTLEGCLDLLSEQLRAATMAPTLKASLEAAKAKAQSLLLGAYSAASSALVEEGDLAGALAAELRALQVSQEAGNKHSEAAAQVHAGRLCLKLGKPNKAMPYLQNFMALYDSAEREGERLDGSDDAFVGMAEALEMAGRPKEALEALSRYADASDRAGDSHSVAEARQRLGEAWLRRGEHAAAEEALGQAYSVRRALLAAGTADQVDLSAARVSLGLAIAAGRTDGLLRAAAGDVEGLLAWKTARNPAALVAVKGGHSNVHAGGAAAAAASSSAE